MSHITELSIEIGLDKFEINCGSRRPAEVYGVNEEDKREFMDTQALDILKNIANHGAGRHALFGVLVSMAADQCELYGEDEGWLKIEIRHCL